MSGNVNKRHNRQSWKDLLTGGLVVRKSVFNFRIFCGIPDVVQEGSSVHICIHLARTMRVYSLVVDISEN